MELLLIKAYLIIDADDACGDIYVTHQGKFDLITVKGADFTILYHQTPVKDLSMDDIKRIRSEVFVGDNREITELDVWLTSEEKDGCVMIYHSNHELCPYQRKVKISYFSKDETVTEPVEMKPTRDQILEQVVKQFVTDSVDGDFTAIDELLKSIPDENLHAYLSDHSQAELADKVSEPVAPKLKKYEIEAIRTMYGDATFIVIASNPDEARKKFEDEAEHYAYKEYSTDYRINDIKVVE